MKQKQTGFTLVELIITITILTILGTVAFVSVQGYSQSARNAIRIENIGKIAVVVDNKKINGSNILWLNHTGSEVINAQIAGTGAIIWVNYKAGELNEIALGVWRDQFIDPLSQEEYKLGITSQKWWSFQVAAAIEDDNIAKAKVIGTYTPRESININWTSGLGTSRIQLQDYTMIGKLFTGDTLTWSLVPPDTKITSISYDGIIISLNKGTISNTWFIALANNEVEGLILDSSGTQAVTDGNTSLPYIISPSGSSWGWSLSWPSSWGWGSSGSSGWAGWGSSGSSSWVGSSGWAGSSGWGLTGPTPGPAGAQEPIEAWTWAIIASTIQLPDSDNYNLFTVDSWWSGNNTNYNVEIGNQNTTIDFRWWDDVINAGYGNNSIDISGGNNNITVGDGYNEIATGFGSDTISFWNGDNEINKQWGNLTLIGGNWSNTITLGFGNTVNITLGDGDNTISGAGGNYSLTLGDGDNIFTPGGSGNHTILFGTGSNTINGSWGNMVITTASSGTGIITFGNNQSQRLNWNGGDITINDFWRWWQNRISFENISDINTCSDVATNTTMIGSEATITSVQGILIINIMWWQTDLNCNTTMIF